ncbi:hypothetical protein [Streptomyces sp. NPDC001070]
MTDFDRIFDPADRVFVHAGYPPAFPALRMGALGAGAADTGERWRGVIGSLVHRA